MTALIATDVVLTVKRAAGGEEPDAGDTVNVPAGRPVRFSGCVARCCPRPDLLVRGGAGTVYADEDGAWYLTNTSSAVTLRVWNLDDPHDQVRVLPGGTLSPPFDLAAVAGATGHILTVFGPEPTGTPPGWCVSDVPVAWGIDPTSRRYEVMVALVAPRMQGDVCAPLPTAREIGEQLGMSHRTVQEHLSALVRTLEIPTTKVRRPGWVQEALVTYALNHPYVPPAGERLPW
ncbi:response regulator transcription factor [Antribacter gilvus]|uniref:response regulator transcription factor n=1 Tax=Antribacter gilvus TaxID=2304675 RepID=UPI000F78904D|nr:response regulator transcription factor [Antribacter gilvus]